MFHVSVFAPIHPPKTKMEPENDDFQKGISSCKGPFSGSMLVFQGVYLWVSP